MSAIRCHFDGKAFVPDEPVQLVPGQTAEVRIHTPNVEFTGGSGAPIGELLKAEATGGWDGIFDPALSSTEVADELRRRASGGSYHKQRAMIDLHEYWDEQRRGRQDKQEAQS